eukprot:jgi/Chlat1/4425/Chrsp29S04388
MTQVEIRGVPSVTLAILRLKQQAKGNASVYLHILLSACMAVAVAVVVLPAAAPVSTRRRRVAITKRVCCSASPSSSSSSSSSTSSAQAQPAASSRSPAGAVLALKEWAATVAALGEGQQALLLRKGGIKERAFAIKSSSFLLLPTYFHASPALLKPYAARRYTSLLEPPQREGEVEEETVEFVLVARCTGAWATGSQDVLRSLSDLHIWTDEYLDLRLKWRSKQPLTIMELRAYQLPSPHMEPAGPHLAGCVSWVPLPCAHTNLLDWSACRPAMEDEQFRGMQGKLRDRLRGDEVECLAVPEL